MNSGALADEHSRLRHVRESVMLARGVPLIVVSRQLGHANPNITATIYARLLGDSQPMRPLRRSRGAPARERPDVEGHRALCARGAPRDDDDRQLVLCGACVRAGSDVAGHVAGIGTTREIVLTKAFSEHLEAAL